MSERPRVSIRFPQLEFAVRTVKGLVHLVRQKKDVSNEPVSLVNDAFNTASISLTPEEQRRESIIGIYVTGKEIDPMRIAQQLREQGFNQVEISSMLSKIEEKRRVNNDLILGN